jgi:hypothetical protein
MSKVRDVVGQEADPLLADAMELADDARATLKDVREQAPTDVSDLQVRLQFVQVITEAAGSLKTTTDAIYTRLGRDGLTLTTASPEVQEAMAAVARVGAELEEMAMAYTMGRIGRAR